MMNWRSNYRPLQTLPFIPIQLSVRRMEYRRSLVAGGSYFFTLVTYSRMPIFADAATVDVLREAFRCVQKVRPFTIDAIVVMPDHLHCIWTLPPGDTDFATRWRLIKTAFTKHCDPALRRAPDPVRKRRQEQRLWQHRYWEHLLQDEADFARHVDYIHYNPVKHGLATSPLAWRYSSFCRYVEAGAYAPDWGCCKIDLDEIGNE
jgi:putative transposase